MPPPNAEQIPWPALPALGDDAARGTEGRAPQWPALGDATWFAEEVQAHEPALRAYLHRQFPTLTNQDDIVQESYLKLWRARGAGRIRSAKAYLFTIARNAALAIFRRQRISPEISVGDFEGLRILEDDTDVVGTVSAAEEFELALEAIDRLPPRCREVVMLRCLHGMAYDEIAVRLAISEHTVRAQMTKAVKYCVEYFRHRGIRR